MTTAGIDYGLGRSNIDQATGIRYGVISVHSVMGEALSDIYDHGENLSYKAAVDAAKARINAALTPIFDDLGVLPYSWQHNQHARDEQAAYLTPIVESVWENIEQEFNDRYEEQDDHYRYEQDGYVIETSSLGLFIIKSPYTTETAFCSPCAPGAGDLDTPREGGVRTYCLGPDWFDGEQAPYPVTSIGAVNARRGAARTMILGNAEFGH